MPTLHNLTDQDVFSHVAGVIVPAAGSVEVDDEQAERVNTVSGVWVLTSSKLAAEVAAVAARSTAKRGGKRAEVSAAPVRETR